MNLIKRLFLPLFLIGSIIAASQGLAAKESLNSSFGLKTNLESRTKTSDRYESSFKKFRDRKQFIEDSGPLYISYEEWKSLVENPESIQARIGKIKASLIKDNGEDVLNKLSPGKKKKFQEFRRYFTLDAEKLKPANPEYLENFFEAGFPIIVEEQMSLDKAYQRTFDFKNPSTGDMILFYDFYNNLRTHFYERN